MLNLDAVVYDIQDVGARFYTYSCTLLYALQEAAKAHKPFWVLDRPNPITGTHIEGPIMQKDLESFVGCYDIPLRHGMTFGELATFANVEGHLGADLHVVKMTNWMRGDWFDATTLSWIDPSPEYAQPECGAALSRARHARGERPTIRSAGEPTRRSNRSAPTGSKGKHSRRCLNSRFIPGVRVYPTRFKPTSSHFAGQQIEGVRFVITDREAFDSTRLGIELAAALQNLYPGKIDFQKCRHLIGNHRTIGELELGRDASLIWSQAQREATDIRRATKTVFVILTSPKGEETAFFTKRIHVQSIALEGCVSVRHL